MTYFGVLAEWLRRLIRNQLGIFPREFKSHRRRFDGKMSTVADRFAATAKIDSLKKKKKKKWECRHWDLHPG